MAPHSCPPDHGSEVPRHGPWLDSEVGHKAREVASEVGVDDSRHGVRRKPRGVELSLCQSASRSHSTYRRDQGAQRHARTTRPTPGLPASQGLSTLGGGYCHDLFPELSPTFMHASRSSLVHHRVHYSLPSPSSVTPHESVPIRTNPASASHAAKPSARFGQPLTQQSQHPHASEDDRAIGYHVADHVTDTQPRATQATSSAGHLPGVPVPWGSQPSFPSIY